MKTSIILPYFNRLSYLHATLQTFDVLYRGKNLEIILVDDGSSQDQRPDSLTESFPNLNLKIIRLDPKTGSNPCLPYNVGVRAATGDVLVLSSPETIHTASIFDQAGDFKDLTLNQLYCFSVFCPTRPDINELAMMCDTKERLQMLREKVELHVSSGFDEKSQYPWSNYFGSWYLHGKHRRTELNFLTAMKRELFYEMSGFDERFRQGTGCDDQEFRNRLMTKIWPENIRYFDQTLALHLNHPPVYGSGDPISNLNLFLSLPQNPYLPNDNWGRV